MTKHNPLKQLAQAAIEGRVRLEARAYRDDNGDPNGHYDFTLVIEPSDAEKAEQARMAGHLAQLRAELRRPVRDDDYGKAAGKTSDFDPPPEGPRSGVDVPSPPSGSDTSGAEGAEGDGGMAPATGVEIVRRPMRSGDGEVELRVDLDESGEGTVRARVVRRGEGDTGPAGDADRQGEL